MSWAATAFDSWKNEQEAARSDANSAKLQDTIDDLVDALKSGALPEPVSVGLATQNLHMFSDEQIRQHVTQIAQAMPTLEHNSDVQRDTDLGFGQQQDVVADEAWRERAAKLIQRHEQQRSEFNKRYRPTAVALRDEMRRRLGLLPPFEQNHRSVALDIGMLAGPAPLEDAAVELENLARQMPEQEWNHARAKGAVR